VKKKIGLYLSAILAVLCLTGIDAEAKKPEITRYDAHYLDTQVSVNLQWQSSEAVVLVRVAAGSEVKEIKIDPYDNKKTRSGYTGEVNVVLETDVFESQEVIPYTIQLEDEDGQKSNLVTGKVTIPLGVAQRRDRDQWGKEKLVGTPRSGQKDMIEQLREVTSVLAAPPVILDVTVNNPGRGTVTFKTKATHSVGMREINFRIFDAQGRQVDSQQISATGKLWEGTSKDFTLNPGSYSVIAQAVDASGSTSRESKANFTIAGVTTPVTPPIVTPPVVTPPVVTPPVVTPPVVTPPVVTPPVVTPPVVTPPVVTPPVVTPPVVTPPVVTPPVTPPVVEPPGAPQGCQVKVTDAIPGHHGSQGVFFKKSVKLIVPDLYSQIVVTADAGGNQKWDADDWANFTVTSPSGTKQTASLGKNDAWGKPIGEQYILSNVLKLQPGLNTIDIELWNEFTPPGNNQGSSAMWLVVKCPVGQRCQNGLCVATTPPPPPLGPGMEANTDRPGLDYRSFDLPAADPKLCQDACAGEANCRAFTYVRPGVQGPGARCWLKSSVPNPVSNNCCVSGVKTTPPPPPIMPPPAVTLPAGTELVTQPNLRDGLRSWTIEEWMKPSDGKGEVSSDNNYGVMFRGTKENSRIGIMQSLNNLDVSTYGKIMLTAQIRTEQQQLDGTGWQGREAPVGVFVAYTDVTGVVHNALPIMPSESQTNRMFWEGFYHIDPTGNSKNWHGTKVGKGQWYTYQFDLMTLNPRPKVLHYVGTEGAGWPTREGRIALLSLRGQTATLHQQGLPSIGEPVIYTNGNIAGVQNNPTREATFTIDATHRVTFIYTYHYFNSGKLPGTIALRHSDGTVYGPWQSAGALGQGGVQNAYWFVRPNVEIKAGSYTVVDSDKATWSQNSGSSGAGFVEIRGVRTGTTQPTIKELLTGTNLKGLSNWTIQEWMQPSTRRGEVTEDSEGIRFRSETGNTRMGIMQTINADVSGAQKLILTAVVKTVEQRLDGTGWQGREAPVALFVTYTDVNGQVRKGLGSMANPPEPQIDRMFWHGFYYADPTGNSRNWNGTKVNRGSWYTYEMDLMSLNPKPKIIHAVGVEGSGWPVREGKIQSISLKYYGNASGR